MKYVPHSLWLLFMLAAGTAFAESARTAMEQGVQLYEKGQYEQAAQAFQQAASRAADEKLDPAVAAFNEASALYKAGKFQEASPKYSEALSTPNLELQAKTYHNRGNALMGFAEALQQQQQLDLAGKSVDEALAMYENAMTLTPGDKAPKINYELALKKKEEIQQQQQEQQQQKQDQQKDDQQKQDQQNKDEQKEQDQQKQDQKNQQGEQQQDQQKDQQEQQKPSKPEDQQQDQQEPQGGEAQPENFEEMTPEEAQLLLDSMKQEEQARRDRIRPFQGQPVPVDKDW